MQYGGRGKWLQGISGHKGDGDEVLSCELLHKIQKLIMPCSHVYTQALPQFLDYQIGPQPLLITAGLYVCPPEPSVRSQCTVGINIINCWEWHGPAAARHVTEILYPETRGRRWTNQDTGNWWSDQSERGPGNIGAVVYLVTISHWVVYTDTG